MNWIDLLTSLGFFTLGSVSIVGIIAFFGKRLFEQYLQKRFQQYQIQFSKLHNDRADVVRNLYTKLVIMGRDMNAYIFPMQFAGDPPREQKRISAGKSAEEFFDYFYLNGIFFEDPVSALVGEMDKLYRDAWVHISAFDNEAKEAESDHEGLSDHALDELTKAVETIESKIPRLKEKLKSQLGDLLGVPR